MALLVFTWPYALIFWTAFALAFLPDFRISARRSEGWATEQDAYSKPVLMLSQGLGVGAAFAIASTMPSGKLPYPMLFFWLGICIMIGGSLLRRTLQTHARIELLRERSSLTRSTPSSSGAHTATFATLHTPPRSSCILVSGRRSEIGLVSRRCCRSCPLLSCIALASRSGRLPP